VLFGKEVVAVRPVIPLSSKIVSYFVLKTTVSLIILTG
jgi:hypothetical protein